METGAALRESGVPVIEFRAAVIVGTGSMSFEMIRYLVERLPVMVCPRWVTRTRCQPIAIADGLHYLVAVIVRPGALSNGPRRGGCRHGNRIGNYLWTVGISRADTAAFMLDQVTSDDYLRAAPGVCR